MVYATFVAFYWFFICIAFAVAAYSVASNNLNGEVLATASLAFALFIWQACSWKQKRDECESSGFWHTLKSFWIWHNLDIVVVGVAIYYPMLMIGVSSFGKILLDSPISGTKIMILLIRQVFLNFAATKLVEAFGRARIEKS